MHPERSPRGQTSLNQILLFVLPFVVGIIDCFVQRFRLHSVDCLPEHGKDFHYVIYRVTHGYLFRLVLIQIVRPMWLGSLRTRSRGIASPNHLLTNPFPVSRGKPLVRHTCGICRSLSCQIKLRVFKGLFKACLVAVVCCKPCADKFCFKGAAVHLPQGKSFVLCHLLVDFIPHHSTSSSWIRKLKASCRSSFHTPSNHTPWSSGAPCT